MTARILLAEDEANYRRVFRMLLSDSGAELIEAEDGLAALALLEREEIDLVLTDITMPRMDGMQLLDALRERPSAPPVVVITAYGSIDSAVLAMQKGAIDYLTKPFDEQRLKLTIERALKLTALLAENRRLREAALERYDFSSILGESEPLVAALTTAGKVAATDASVLVRGESGTGKELLAKAIHFNSARRAGPFVAVNCAAIPEGLLEAELFGAEAGAFTGAVKRRRGRVELARGGTLFLDEIGELPLVLQAKLLRLLQERSFMPLGAEKELLADARFVFATHRDLEAELRAGRFREDLYYRVSVLPVTLPPLRDRGSDILLLARAIARRVAEGMGKRAPSFTKAAEAALLRARWRGNVRELSNVVERAVILADGDVIDAAALGLAERRASGIERGEGGRFLLPDDGIVLDELERDLVKQALDKASGNKTQAAKLLGLTRATLRYRVEKLALDG